MLLQKLLDLLAPAISALAMAVPRAAVPDGITPNPTKHAK